MTGTCKKKKKRVKVKMPKTGIKGDKSTDYFMYADDSKKAYVLADLSEEHREHVLALKADGKVH